MFTVFALQKYIYINCIKKKIKIWIIFGELWRDLYIIYPVFIRYIIYHEPLESPWKCNKFSPLLLGVGDDDGGSNDARLAELKLLELNSSGSTLTIVWQLLAEMKVFFLFWWFLY